MVTRFRISEQELELTFVRNVQLELALADGRTVKLMPRNWLRLEGGDHYDKIKYGAEREYDFDLPDEVDRASVVKSTLAVTGYYLRYSERHLSPAKAVDERGGARKLSSLPASTRGGPWRPSAQRSACVAGWMGMKTVFVFVSSPSDAADERKRVVRLIERLNVDFADIVRLEPVRWEDRAYEAHQGFQEQIRKSTTATSSSRCYAAGSVARSRRIRRPHSARGTLEDAKPLLTGTTYEIVTAIAARHHGKQLPDIYAFRYALAPAPALNAPDRADIESQWKELEAFVAQVFITAEGYFKGALEPYHSIDEFETKADRALRQWLEEKVIKSRALAWPIATKGSPFRDSNRSGRNMPKCFWPARR